MRIVFKVSLVKFIAGIVAALVVITFLLQEYNIYKITSEGSLDQFTEMLNEFIPEEMNKFNIPGVSIAVIRDSAVVWDSAYGFADVENPEKMTSDTPCKVQSISKSVTAWGVIKLVEEGQLELDKPISRYIKSINIPKDLQNTTIRQLLSHTSGLAIGDFMKIYSPLEDKPTLRENLEQEIVLSNEPGLFAYSNVGFNLLELVIEDITERDFAEYMETEVLKPIGMNNSSFNWEPELNIPMGYGISGKPVPVYVYPEKASGGLFATAKDIALFAKAGMNDSTNEYKVLNKDSINSMYSPNTGIRGIYSLVFDAYGLGYFIENPDSGFLSVSHGGQGTGIMTHMQFSPETGDGIVILTNSQRSWPFIASVLRLWTKWSDLPSVGMTKVLLGRCILLVLVGFGLFLVFIMLWKMTEEITKGKRDFLINVGRIRFSQIIQLIMFVLLIGLTIWNISRPYTTLTSIFPIVSVWIWICVSSIAAAMLLNALFPKSD